MTTRMFAVSLVLAFAVTVATGEVSKTPSATLATGEKPELAVTPSIPTVPVVVTNFPATQAVNGTVNVTGEVAISNLPAPCAEPTFAVLQVAAIPGPTQNSVRAYTSTPFTVAGWKVVTAQLIFSDGVTLFAGGSNSVGFRNFPTDPVGGWSDLDNAGTGAVRGAEAVVRTTPFSDTYTGLHFSIYLSR